jgi:hypothetical protein
MCTRKSGWLVLVGFYVSLFPCVLGAAESGAGGQPPDARPTASAPDALPQLQKPVTLQPPYAESYPGAPTDRLFVEYAVKALCDQVGLPYGFDASRRNVGSKAALWVRPDFTNVPMQQALTQMLEPQGLTFSVDGTAIVLQLKGTATLPGQVAVVPPTATGPGALPAAAGPVTDDEIKQAIAAVPGATAVERARNAAIAIAQGRLVQEGMKLQQEQQKVAQAQASLADLRRQGEPLQAEADQLAVGVREAEENFRKAEERGREENGVRYFASWELDEFNKWRQRLLERRARYEPVRQELEAKLAEYHRQDTQFQVAQRSLAALQQEYRAKFNAIYAEVYPRCAAVLGVQVEKTANEIKAQQRDKLDTIFQPGRYTWTANAEELGEVTFDPDGTYHGLGGEQGRWEVTPDGLAVTQGEWRWVFRAGPMKALLGSGRTSNIADGVQKALLRPVEPAAEAKPAPPAPAEPPAEAAPSAKAEK